jgi:hypothetical protein
MMINNNFAFRANSLKLISFFETVNTRMKWVISFLKISPLILQWIPAGKMIVPESSATLGYPAEVRVGLDGDHLTIAKYGSKRESNFVIVVNTLHKLVAKISCEMETQSAVSDV